MILPVIFDLRAKLTHCGWAMSLCHLKNFCHHWFRYRIWHQGSVTKNNVDLSPMKTRNLTKWRHNQGWGQIRFIKFKYKYKYKNLDFSNTNTNTNIFFNFDSNTNTNTNTSIQIQIQIRSTKYICRNCSVSKIGQFYKSQDICSWPVFPYV